MDEKNARDLEFKNSCMAIEPPPVDDPQPGLQKTASVRSSTFSSINPAETLVEGSETPKPRSLTEAGPPEDFTATHTIPTIQANVAVIAESLGAEESAPLRPSMRKSSFMSSSGTVSSFSNDPSVPPSLRLRDEEIQHHAALVHNLLEEISDVQYRIDHGIRHRMHDGILKIHWDEWTPFATKHGHSHFHRAFEQHKHVAKYWLDLHEGVKPVPLAATTKQFVHFTDALCRHFDIPYAQCRKWPDMSNFITHIFDEDYDLKEWVSDRRYSLVFEDGRIIVPRFWEATVEPGINIFMEMNTAPPAQAAPARKIHVPSTVDPLPTALPRVSSEDLQENYPILKQPETFRTADSRSDIENDPGVSRGLSTGDVQEPRAHQQVMSRRAGQGGGALLPNNRGTIAKNYKPVQATDVDTSEDSDDGLFSVPLISKGVSLWLGDASKAKKDHRRISSSRPVRFKSPPMSPDSPNLQRASSYGPAYETSTIENAADRDALVTSALLWPSSIVRAWLIINDFSVEWQDAIRRFELCGDFFLGLHGPEGTSFLHQSFYPVLRDICATSKKPWDRGREQKQGRRLQRLLELIVRRIDALDPPPRRVDSSLNRPSNRFALGTENSMGTVSVDLENMGISRGKESPVEALRFGHVLDETHMEPLTETAGVSFSNIDNYSKFDSENFNLDFTTLEGSDILESFDFDSFLNTSAEDAWNFDPQTVGGGFDLNSNPSERRSRRFSPGVPEVRKLVRSVSMTAEQPQSQPAVETDTRRQAATSQQSIRTPQRSRSVGAAPLVNEMGLTRRQQPPFVAPAGGPYGFSPQHSGGLGTAVEAVGASGLIDSTPRPSRTSSEVGSRSRAKARSRSVSGPGARYGGLTRMKSIRDSPTTALREPNRKQRINSQTSRPNVIAQAEQHQQYFMEGSRTDWRGPTSVDAERHALRRYQYSAAGAPSREGRGRSRSQDRRGRSRSDSSSDASDSTTTGAFDDLRRKDLKEQMSQEFRRLLDAERQRMQQEMDEYMTETQSQFVKPNSVNVSRSKEFERQRMDQELNEYIREHQSQFAKPKSLDVSRSNEFKGDEQLLNLLDAKANANAAAQIDIPAPKAAPKQKMRRPVKASKPLKDAAPATGELAERTFDIIAEELAVDHSELLDDVQWADLGVESLMSLIISNKLREDLKLEVESSWFTDYASVGALRKHLAGMCGSAAGHGGRTALQAAAEGGHMEVMSRLLDANADINAAAATSFEGRAAFQAAAEGDHYQLMDLLEQYTTLTEEEIVGVAVGV